MRKLIFYFFIFLSCNSQDLQISGVVLDQLTRDPIPFANISVLGKSIGAITDSVGQFKINDSVFNIK